MRRKRLYRKKYIRQTGSLARKWASRMITWLGLSVIGILTIPTGILIGLMFVVWSLTDRMVRQLNGKKRLQIPQ